MHEETTASLRGREPVLAAAGILVAVAYQTTWYLAPDLLRVPLIPGGAIPVSYGLFMAAILLPIGLAWLCVRGDAA